MTARQLIRRFPPRSNNVQTSTNFGLPRRESDSVMDAASPAARDVINADKIRAAIDRRSQAREDHADIARWLRTHFFRWTINSFAHVLPVRSIDGWRMCIGAAPPPDWFLSKLAAGNGSMIYIDPEHPRLRDDEARMVEFFNARLGTYLAGKFHRVTFAVADAAWRKDHERLQRLSRQGWWPSQPHALVEVATTPHGDFVELRATGSTLRAELAYESFHMQHCLGQFARHDLLEGGYGDYYARSCEQGRMRLFSLRDERNRPHVTVSLIEDLGEWSLEQIKGKQNTTPGAKYTADVLCLLNTLRPYDAGCVDLLRMGIAQQSEAGDLRYVAFDKLRDAARQHAMIGAFPQLLSQHPRPGAPVQWLALGAGADASTLTGVASPHAPVVAALHAMAAEDASSRTPLSAALASVFPQWLGAPAAHRAPERHASWLGRLLARSRPATAPQGRRHCQWALAVAEPLFYRLGLAGGSKRTYLAAPDGIPDRLRSQVESELAVENTTGAATTERFLETFFRIPSFENPMLVDARTEPQEDVARDLLAWHAMRQSYLLRLLAAWERVDEARGWRLLLLNAQRVQDCFSDWQDFGSAAARGHATWLRWNGRGAGQTRTAEVALQDFQAQYRCPWKRLPWSEFDLAESIAPHPARTAA